MLPAWQDRGLSHRGGGAWLDWLRMVRSARGMLTVVEVGYLDADADATRALPREVAEAPFERAAPGAGTSVVRGIAELPGLCSGWPGGTPTALARTWRTSPPARLTTGIVVSASSAGSLLSLDRLSLRSS